MSLHANPRERLLELAASDLAAAPGSTTPPHFVISPLGANGEHATGITFALIAPTTETAMAPSGAAFSVKLWLLNPTMGMWINGATVTSVAFGAAYVLHDLPGGSHVYLQVLGSTGAGYGILSLAELTA